ncbi:MAG: hypothetical protein JSS28_06775 [Proteobacteria bacterium]|nr:hypothetical protein [Pseudomonadota bacterium]
MKRAAAGIWKIEVEGKYCALDPIADAALSFIQMLAKASHNPVSNQFSLSEMLKVAAGLLPNFDSLDEEAVAIVKGIVEKLIEPNSGRRRPQLRIVRNAGPKDSG